MNDKDPFSIGIYRDMVRKLLDGFTDSEIVDVLTGKISEYKDAINQRHCRINCYDNYNDYIGGMTLATYPDTPLNLMYIRHYINHALTDDERVRVMRMIRSHKDFYGFFKMYFTDFHFADTLTRFRNYKHTQRVVNTLKKKRNGPINLYHFHRSVYFQIEDFIEGEDISLPVMETLNRIQEKYIENKDRIKAIRLAKEHYLPYLNEKFKPVLLGTTDSIDEKVWDLSIWEGVGLDIDIQGILLYVGKFGR